MGDQQRSWTKDPDVRLQIALENALTDARHRRTADRVNGPSLLAKVAPKLRNFNFSPGTRIKARFKEILRPVAYHTRDFLARDVRLQLADLSATLQRNSASLQRNQGAMQEQLQRLAMRIEHLESQAWASRGLVETLVNRNVLALGDDAVLVRTPFGYVYCPRNDDALIVYLSDDGQLEQGLGKLLARILGAGMVFVDVGANVGYHTLHAARLVGEQGRVWAFEPTPAIFGLLERTLILNGLAERVFVHNFALGANTSLADLYVGRRSAHNSLYALSDNDGIVQVPVRRLDDIMPANQKVEAIKIDVEGAELEVLRGMPGVLRANPDTVVIAEYGPSHLARTGIARRDWLDAFFALGYEGFAVEEPSGTCVPLARIELERVASVNIAFVMPGSNLRAKVLGS